MKITGIICEYNPFHNGHKYLIDTLRERGAELIVCAMSGSFVQRGESAVTDKFTRAACAVAGGADLVVELPFPYCMASAEFFASAGVGVLASLGVDTLGFGAESADAVSLRHCAQVTLSQPFTEQYRLLCREGMGSAAAYFEAYKSITGENMPGGSNDILALAYVKEILRAESGMGIDVIRREGTDYNSDSISKGELPSATALRKKIDSDGVDALAEYVPEASLELIRQAKHEGLLGSQIENISSDITTFLRMSDADNFAEIADVGDGLAERICASANKTTSYDELLSGAATANYTAARVRRGIINMMIGVTYQDLDAAPAYVQLLAANKKGREYLAARRKMDGLPIVTKPADARDVAGGERQCELTRRAEALWCMTLPAPLPADTLTRRRPIFI